jgi:membrane protease YdiL (CAAX protease family)
MVKRILIVWAVANFVIIGIVSWLAGGWYSGWPVSPVIRAVAELGLIMLPNIAFPVLTLRFAWPEAVAGLRDALGWRGNGWWGVFCGVIGFAVWYLLIQILVRLVGGSIPYNFPNESGEGSGISLQGFSDVWLILGLLLGLAALMVITVAGEETMFRGFIQTQIGNRYGTAAGIVIAAILFGLRHLPNDLFFANVWQATPQMWFARLSQLYTTAILLGLVRRFGKSTYASAIVHGLIYLTAIFGLG